MQNINLSGLELRSLLKTFGYTQPEFAIYCNKSVATIKRQLLEVQVARRYSEQFREMVGQEGFDAELCVLRARKSKRGWNNRYLLNELCDKSNDNLTVQEFRTKIGL